MFIVTWSGCPHAAESLDESQCLNRLAVINRTWERCVAFDMQQRYRCVPSRDVELSFFQKAMAHSVYNPMTDITLRYEPCGSYVLADIVDEVAKGLETDDDIIQQWFSADQVLKLLRASSTFDEMVDAVECVCGGFEAGPRLRAIVDRVLGPEAFP